MTINHHMANPSVAPIAAPFASAGVPSLADFADHRAAYAGIPMSYLLAQWTMLRTIALPGAVPLSMKALEVSSRIGATRLMESMVRATAFRVFCGGESMQELESVLQMLRQKDVLAVLNYAVEDEGGTDAALENNTQRIIDTVEAAAQHGGTVPFACLKPTAIAPASLFTRMTALIEAQRLANPDAPGALTFDRMQHIDVPAHSMPSAVDPASLAAVQPLTSEEQGQLSRALDRFARVCDSVQKHNLLLLIDAERSYQQPAVDMMYRWCSATYNQHTRRVYNTYQTYMLDANARIADEVRWCKRNGTHLGAKVVRGAYMHEERERAARLRIASPIQRDFAATTASYDTAMEQLFAFPDADLFIATHNVHTCMRAAQLMQQMRIPNDKVFFAQLYGMCDEVTFTLARFGYRVAKYIPFGPVDGVMPYLVRRAMENRDIMGAAVSSRKLLCREIGARAASA